MKAETGFGLFAGDEMLQLGLALGNLRIAHSEIGEKINELESAISKMAKRLGVTEYPEVAQGIRDGLAQYESRIAKGGTI